MRTSALAALALVASGCGYRAGGRADLLPRNIRTIAVPAFANGSTRYKLTERLPAAITRELIRRTRYHVVPERGEADAILDGIVHTYSSYPTVSDPATGRAVAVQLMVTVELKLTDRASGGVLYHRNLEFRQRYEISTDQVAYFEESGPALERLSQDVARTAVSAILEGF